MPPETIRNSISFAEPLSSDLRNEKIRKKISLFAFRQDSPGIMHPWSERRQNILTNTVKATI